jgi:hypothetical protein
MSVRYDDNFSTIVRSVAVAPALPVSCDANMGINFPYDGMPPSFSKLIGAWQSKVNVPGQLLHLALLSALSITCAAGYEVEGIDGRNVPLSLFSLALAPSGVGKTTAQDFAIAPIKAFAQSVERKWSDGADVRREKSEDWKELRRKLVNKRDRMTINGEPTDEISRIIEEHGQEKPVIGQYVRLLTRDATWAGMRSLLRQAYPTGAIVNSDSGDFLNKILSGEMSNFCALWSGEDITVERGQESVSVKNPRLSLMLMTQPRYFNKFLERQGQNFVESGLAARFLMYLYDEVDSIIPFRAADSDDSPIEKYRCWASEMLTELFGEDGNKYPEKRIKITLERRSTQVLYQRTEEVKNNIGPGLRYHNIAEIARKYPEHACRIAALYALFSHKDDPVVRCQDMIFALSFMDHLLERYALIVSEASEASRDRKAGDNLQDFISSVSLRYSNPFPATFNVNSKSPVVIVDCYSGRQYVSHSHILQSGPDYLRNAKNLSRVVQLLKTTGRIIETAYPTRGGRSGAYYAIGSVLKMRI